MLEAQVIVNLVQHVVVEEPLFLEADVLLQSLQAIATLPVANYAAPDTVFAWEASLQTEPARVEFPVKTALDALV